MATKPNENWQERVYEAFTSNVKLDINNPQEGLSGPIVYNWMASTKSGEQSSVGMTEGGIYHIYNDQCIEIIGGQKAEGGVCVNIAGTKGDVCITAMSNGDVKLTGTNIVIDASKNVEINAPANFVVKAGKIDMKSSECYIKAPRGRIRVKDVSWSGAVFKNTSVPESLYTGKLADVASSIDTKALQSQLKEAETALSAELESFGANLQDFL